MADSMRAKAIALAKQGFRVFPLATGTKDRPVVPVGFPKPPKGQYQDLIPSSDPAVVALMWQPNGHGPRQYNIGINTNNLLVVDVDNKNGKQGDRVWLKLVLELGFDQNTVEASTPTGGRHLFYRLPEGTHARNTESRLGEGVDTRGWHGYVVAPGSIVPSGEYRWIRAPGLLPMAPVAEALLARCMAGKATEPKAVAEVVEGLELDTPVVLERARQWLLGRAPEAIENASGDATTYWVACHVKGFGITQEACLELMDTWNELKAHPPWSLEELETKVANAYAYGTEPIGIRAPEGQFETVELHETGVQPNSVKKSHLFWSGFNAGADLATGKGNAWLVKKYLGRNEMSVLYGDSNTGKTFIALDLAYHIATGKPWNGRKTAADGRLVVYVAAEAGRSVFARLEALRRRYQPTAEPPLVVVPCLVDLFSPNADLKPLLALLAEIAEAYDQPIAEVTVDTLARAMGPGDENSARDMGVLVKALDRIRVDTGGAHVMVVHHSGKNKANGARGSSALRAATDTELEVEGNQVIMRKQRNGELMSPVGFRLATVKLGEDEDGEAITSCTVEVGAAVDFEPHVTNEQQGWLDEIKKYMADNKLTEFTNEDIQRAFSPKKATIAATPQVAAVESSALAIRTCSQRSASLTNSGKLETVSKDGERPIRYRIAATSATHRQLIGN